MKINCGNIVLRDLKFEDIDNLVRWHTVDDEWMDWDAPWEKDDPFDAVAYRAKQLEYIAKPKDENRTRYGFQLEYEGCHIGWVNSYKIDENYNYAVDGWLAIGIDICEPDKWGKGIGRKAYAAFINYLFSCGYNELYTQTWSGNERMIRMAERIGFRLCHRDVGVRQVNGHVYDRVTMKIAAKFWFCSGIDKTADVVYNSQQ